MGKIKSVNSGNVAEYVNERKALGSEVKTAEQVAQMEAQKPPEGTAELPLKQAEPPVEAKPVENVSRETKGEKPPKNSVQERIDELTRQKKELDEFAQTEYETRLQMQRRITELEAQAKNNQSPPPKEEPEPDPAKYEDQKKFLKDWGDWNRKKAIAEFQASEEKRKQEDEVKRLIAEANQRRQESLNLARQQFTDFDDVIQDADLSVEMRKTPAPNQMLAGLLSESQYQAHILYHLAKNPSEVGKLNALRPPQMALAIGRLETQFAEKTNGKTVVSPTESIPKPNLPEPSPSLGTGGGNAPFDPSAPMRFDDYKRRRLEEIRQRRARK